MASDRSTGAGARFQLLDAGDLLARMISEKKPPVLVVGSGVCLPLVPGSEEMVQLIADEYGGGNQSDAQAMLARLPPTGNRYQAAFAKLLSRRGADAANAVIRRAVLRASSPICEPDLVSRAAAGDPDACEQLVDDIDAWQLTDGLRAFGHVAVRLAAPRLSIITTNFDPLIDVAIRLAGGKVKQLTFAEDGRVQSARASRGDVVIVHVHGDWYSADTLHTPFVLTAQRPKLRASLGSLLRGRLVILFGYGGWDDVIASALDDVVADPRPGFEIRWGFHETDPDVIRKRYAHVVDRLESLLERRVFLHGGVDAQRFFPAALRKLHVARPQAGLIHSPPQSWSGPARTHAWRHRVAAFDLDGTLIRGDGFDFSWELIWSKLGFGREIQNELKREYQQRSVGGAASSRTSAYARWCEKACAHFRTRGLTRAALKELAAPLRLTAGCREALRRLRSEGIATAIISGGVDTFLDDVFPDFREYVDFVFINQLQFDDTGDLRGVRATAYDFQGKAEALDLVCAWVGCTSGESVFVGDHFNDEAAMLRAARAIAYPPQDLVTDRIAQISIADDDLMTVLPHILVS